MTDLSGYSDDELMAMYAMPSLIKQESGGRAGVLGPQTRYGRAEGLTQMLPATAQAMAKKLGVEWRPELMRANTPEAAAYQERLGQAYLAQGLAETGNLPDALRYYHGGPDRRQWGPKTEAYSTAILTSMGMGGAEPVAPANDLASLSNDELLAMYQEGAAPTPPPRGPQVARSRNGGVTVELLPPEAPRPTIAQDALSGFLQPFQTLAEGIKADRQRLADRAVSGKLPTLGEAITDAGRDVLNTGRLIGDVVGLAAAPVMAAVRPISRAVNNSGLPLYERPKLADIGKGKAPQRITDPVRRQAVIEGTVNTALSAAQPARGKLPRPAGPKGVEVLRAEKTAAYQAVDQLGVQYAPASTAQLGADIASDLASKRINPKVTPKAHAVMEDVVDQLSSGQPVSLGQLDDMRQQVWLSTGKGDDAEKFFGDRIREMIDAYAEKAGPADLLNGSGPDAVAAIKAAREANRKYRNVQEVTNRTESADLRAASTYAGGNKANATRQNLRPLIDPKSPQRLKGLTPAEAKALNRVVRGTAGQNAMRLTGKVLDPRGLLGAAVQTIGGSTTGGLTTLSIPAGIAASEASNAMTAKAVADALKVLAGGGKVPPPALPKINPVALKSIPGLVGAAEVAAPLARLPSERSKTSTSRKARSKRPEKR